MQRAQHRILTYVEVSLPESTAEARTPPISTTRIGRRATRMSDLSLTFGLPLSIPAHAHSRARVLRVTPRRYDFEVYTQGSRIATRRTSKRRRRIVHRRAARSGQVNVKRGVATTP